MIDKERQLWEQMVQNMQNQQMQEETRRMTAEKKHGEMASYMETYEKSLAELQLDLDKTLERMKHILSSHQVKLIGNREEWVEPDDDRLKILTEFGVQLVMRHLYNYLNPNMLLSFYPTPEVIDARVKKIVQELAEEMYQQYENVFFAPDPEEIYEKWYVFKSDDESNEHFYFRCLIWTKGERMKRFSSFYSIIESIDNQIHATYMRALQGKERATFREHVHVTQSLNNQQELIPQQKRGFFARLTGR